MFSVSLALKTGETCSCPPAWASCGNGSEQPYTARFVVKTEDKGHCPLPRAHSPSHPCPCATHQRHDPADRQQARPDATTWLQCHLHVLGDEEGLIVPDVKFCKEAGDSTVRYEEVPEKQAKARCACFVPVTGSPFVTSCSRVSPSPSPSPACRVLKMHIRRPCPALPLPEKLQSRFWNPGWPCSVSPGPQMTSQPSQMAHL